MVDSLSFVVVGHDVSSGEEHVERLGGFGSGRSGRRAYQLMAKFVRPH